MIQWLSLLAQYCFGIDLLTWLQEVDAHSRFDSCRLSSEVPRALYGPHRGTLMCSSRDCCLVIENDIFRMGKRKGTFVPGFGS